MRQAILKALWRGLDPFAGFPGHLYEVDLQGWGGDHPYLANSVAELKPRVTVEVGVWKGASVATMAAKLRELKIDGIVIAVDTWLGSSEHWTTQQWFDSLAFEHGRPALQKKFMANMLAKGLAGLVVPLPLDSLNAAQVLGQYNIKIDLLHLDGGHDYASVIADLKAWWPLIKPGGILIGDDYNTNGVWPEVRQAFDEYFGQLGLTPFEIAPPKCRIRKPTEFRTYEMLEPTTPDGVLRRVTLGAPRAGGDDAWHAIEGTPLQQYRWMAKSNACWHINVPATPAAILQVKIPYAMDVQPGFAEQSLVFIANRHAEVHVRESAIFARLGDVVPGDTTVELRLPELDVPANIRRTSDQRKLGLAIRILS